MMILWMGEKALNKDEGSVKITTTSSFRKTIRFDILFWENSDRWGQCLIRLLLNERHVKRYERFIGNGLWFICSSSDNLILQIYIYLLLCLIFPFYDISTWGTNFYHHLVIKKGNIYIPAFTNRVFALETLDSTCLNLTPIMNWDKCSKGLPNPEKGSSFQLSCSSLRLWCSFVALKTGKKLHRDTCRQPLWLPHPHLFYTKRWERCVEPSLASSHGPDIFVGQAID